MADPISIGFVGDISVVAGGEGVYAVTETMAVIRSQVGEDVSADADGVLDAFRVRLGGPPGVARFQITTGTLVGDTYTVRAVTDVAAATVEPGAATVYSVSAGSLAVKEGDYLGIYGLPVTMGYTDTYLVTRSGDGVLSLDDATPPAPTPGQVYTLPSGDDDASLGLLQGSYTVPSGAPVIGATGLEVEHPTEETEVDITGVLLLVDSQVGHDVRASAEGIVGTLSIRLGTTGPGYARYIITTGTLGGDDGDEYSIRDTYESTGTLTPGTGTGLVNFGFIPGIAVQEGDYLGIYGLPAIPENEEVHCVVVHNGSQGTARQDTDVAPEPGDVFTMSSPTSFPGVPLLGSQLPLAYADIGAHHITEDHPADEIDVNVTGALWLVSEEVGEDVTATVNGVIPQVLLRPGSGVVGHSEFVLTTGTIDEDGNYNIRAVSVELSLSNDGSGSAATNTAIVGTNLSVEAGDYIGIYGLPASEGGVETVIRANVAQGSRLTVPDPIALPERGDVVPLDPEEMPGLLLIGTYQVVPPSPPDGGCACADDFRFEACDLRTGIVRAILEPTAADWQTTLNAVGQGSMTLATKDIAAREIWPHLTSVYMCRTSGGDATPENPYCEGAFIIDKFTAADTGTTQVGMKSIEDYLWHRVYRATTTFQGDPNAIAAGLVAYTATNGIPLTATYDNGSEFTERDYFAWDRKNIGEAINELVDAEPGIEWEIVHTKSPGGAWSSSMIFRDSVGAVRAIVIQSDVEGAGYGLDVDAADHATLVDAIGEGSEADQLIATALDVGVYPQFDAVPAFKDINVQATLQQQANGYLADHREPVAVPSMTIIGTHDPDPALMRNGDIIERVRTSFGAITFDGPARIVATSWSLGVGGAPKRTYQFLSTGRASETVLNQVIEDPCPDCEPLPPVDYLITSIDGVLSDVMDTDGQLVTTEVTP